MQQGMVPTSGADDEDDCWSVYDGEGLALDLRNGPRDSNAHRLFAAAKDRTLQFPMQPAVLRAGCCLATPNVPSAVPYDGSYRFLVALSATRPRPLPTRQPR